MGQHKKKILLVDDSAFHLARIRELLSEANLEIIECTNGVDAIEVITRYKGELDLLITDLEMPRMSGFELLDWFKGQPFRDEIPVLVLTGAYDLTEVIDTLKELGVSGILEKGGHPHHIHSRVQSILFPEIAERRKHDRALVHLPISFEWGGDSFDAVLTNVSLGGCFMVTEHLVRSGEVVTVKMTVPVNDVTIKISGTVVWLIGGDQWQGRKRSLEGLGVQWIDISHEDKLTLEVYIEERFKETRLFDMLSP